jgi:transcriptional regulator with XRE-family HTH domain
MATSTTERIAETIRQRMAEQGVTQLSLSEATGIARMTLGRRLSGYSAFKTDELAVVCRQLSLAPAQVLADADDAA